MTRPIASLSTVSLSTTALFYLPLEQTIGLAAAAGFDGIELVMCPEIWSGGAARVGALAREHGLAITAVHTSAIGFCPGGRGGALVVDAARAAREVAAPLLVVHYGRAKQPPPELDAEWLRGLEAGGAVLEETPTRISLENQGTFFGQDPAELMAGMGRLLRVAEARDLLLTLDTCHLGTAGHLASDVARLFGARLANVHLSDFVAPGRARSVQLLARFLQQHRMPGEGELALAPFTADLAASGYTGALACEVSPFSLQAWSRPRLERRLALCAARVRSWLESGG